jgi:type VI secretion system secreted protein Hcp
MKRISVCAMFVFVSLFAAQSRAGLHIFLKFDGIDGESTAQGHEKWIDVQSYTWGVSNSFCCGAFSQDFSVTKHTDSTTPVLFQDLITNKLVSTATIDAFSDSNGPQPKFQFSFKDVSLSSLNFNGDTKGSASETLSFTFSKVTLSDFPLDSSGHFLPPITTRWDRFFSNPVPEPHTWMFLGLGALLILGRHFRTAAEQVA